MLRKALSLRAWPLCALLHGASASKCGLGVIHFNLNTIDDANGHDTGLRVNDQTKNQLQVVLVDAYVFLRLLLRLCSEQRNEHRKKKSL